MTQVEALARRALLLVCAIVGCAAFVQIVVVIVIAVLGWREVWWGYRQGFLYYTAAGLTASAGAVMSIKRARNEDIKLPFLFTVVAAVATFVNLSELSTFLPEPVRFSVALGRVGLIIIFAALPATAIVAALLWRTANRAAVLLRGFILSMSILSLVTLAYAVRMS